MRLLIVQYAGDFKEAVENFAAGGSETYFAQRYTVDTVIDLVNVAEDVAVLCCQTKSVYDTRLPNGVRTIGAGFSTHVRSKQILQIVKDYRPTHLIMRTPMPRVLAWAIRKRIPTIAILADCFPKERWKQRVKNFLLAQCLNHSRVEWIFNHGVNSSLALKDIGVKTTKIIPWDYPAEGQTPDRYSPKTLNNTKDSFRLIFVGMLIETKGVGDLLRAAKMLHERGIRVHLQIAGKGDTDQYKQLAQSLAITDHVQFLGIVPNSQITGMMAASDLVIIPSRKEYPEGLPLTIYEGFCSHTPIVASDHPMFRNRLVNEVNSVVFEGGNASSLANCIEKILLDPALYASISAASTESWENLQIPVKWNDILTRWPSKTDGDREFFAAHALSTGIYR